MGSIREYQKRDGTVTYHAEVRLKGNAPTRSSFSSREAAIEWIRRRESHLRGVDVNAPAVVVRHDWSLKELKAMYALPLSELLYRSHSIHRAVHDPSEVQLCHLISVKTGGCSEDCKYCAQSSKYKTPIKASPLMAVDDVISLAKAAAAKGVSRVCLGAAWRQVRTSAQFDRVVAMVREINAMGVEVCTTLGMIEDEQLDKLKDAGVYAYNHNLDTSARYYPEIISTRSYDDRLKTLERVGKAGISICCGGIIGLGETIEDRLELIKTLSTMDPHPGSVPINRLSPVEGTPLDKQQPVPTIALARLLAIARITMPHTMVRLSAGRVDMTDGEQALCFFAGANSMFVGDRLLTVPNPEPDADEALFSTLGLKPRPAFKTTSPSKAIQAPSSDSLLQRRLDKRGEDGTRRSLSFRDANLVDFASNDYLGLASCSKLAKAIEKEYTKLVNEDGILPKIGATGSRLLTGNQPYLEQLEASIATYHNADSALLFNSGYSANTGLLSCIANEGDAIILDSQVHASNWDGARLSRAKTYIFTHNSLESLEKQLKRCRDRHQEVFVCVESLYSMLGDLAPLDAICRLCLRYEAWLIVDEAHATGILGAGGCGLAAELQDASPIIARVHTFGKALGCHGAAVVGSRVLRDYIINHCRTFIYTTAFPLHTQVTISCTYQRLPKLDYARKQLTDLIQYFELQVANSPLPIQTSKTPIQSIRIAEAEAAMALSQDLRSAGLDVRAIRSPTVRRGDECLRVCLHAFNNRSDINTLVDVLSLKNQELFSA